MATESAKGPISQGTCAFCKAELAKNKVTQHLKFCKQRLAANAAREEQSQGARTRLFHILAEGRYNPDYWLHFEVAASEPLSVLDDFLKDMWIDDLDHLSGFTIDGTNYGNDYPDDYFLFSDEIEEEEEEEEEEEPELSEIIEANIDLFLPMMERVSDAAVAIEPALSAWLSEIRKPRSIDELVDYLKQELPKIEKERRRIRKQEKELSAEEYRQTYFLTHFEKLVAESILDSVEDRSLEVLLGRVLKVGQKFSYIYDYGSSTYVNLKVITEREGIVQDEDDPALLLAQNVAPAFSCVLCGKPATQVAMGYFYGNIEERVYCDACAEEKEYELESSLLPIINSPRVGVL